MKIYKLKKILKKSSIVQTVNSRIKEYIFHKEYEELLCNKNSNFKFYDEIYSITKNKICKSKGDLVIIWVGACYEQDYSGFRQALSRFGKVVDFYDVDNNYGLKFPKVRDNLIFDTERKENDRRLLEIYTELSEQQHVDLVIGQMWSTVISPNTFNVIREKGTKVVNIAMDDKLPIHWKTDGVGRLAGSVGLAGNIDLTLNTSKQAVTLYRKCGLSCAYWPLASDPEVFYPSKEKIYDVVFVGSNYGYRKEIIKHLIANGINVKVFGPGFPSGMVSAQKTAKIFSQAKIVLGIGYVAHSRKICTLKLRDFDAMFTGSLYITSRNEDLEEIFQDGVHISYYDSKNSLVNKVKYFLKNENERINIANSAMQLAHSKHNWNYRIESALKILRDISDE